MILMAKDDPIIGDKAIETSVCVANPYLLLGITELGGHIGYFTNILTTD
jgi:predicted alpha/beta-fold hydrolase